MYLVLYFIFIKFFLCFRVYLLGGRDIKVKRNENCFIFLGICSLVEERDVEREGG